MRTGQERLLLMHRRADELQKKKNRTMATIWCGISVLLLVLLVGVTAATDGGHGILSDSVTASSLLSESAGGYVAVAVAAFMIGVIVTAVFMVRKRRR